MIKKRNLQRPITGEEPASKATKENALPWKESLSLSSADPVTVRCLICAREITPRAEAKAKAETHMLPEEIPTSTVELLCQLLKVLKLSPAVCRYLLLESSFSTVTVVYCEVCEKTISNCLKISQEIDNLRHVLEDLTSKIKEDVIESYYCRPDAAGGSGNTSIRKTLVQCWTTCTVKIKQLPANKGKHQVSSVTVIRDQSKPCPISVSQKGQDERNTKNSLPSTSPSPAESADMKEARAADFFTGSSSANDVDHVNFVDEFQEIGSPQNPAPSTVFSDLNETDINEALVKCEPEDLVSTETKPVETVEPPPPPVPASLNRKPNANHDSNLNLNCKTSLRPRRKSQKPLAKYAVDTDADTDSAENISEIGSVSVYSPDSPLQEKNIACTEKHPPLPLSKTKTITKSKRIRGSPKVSKKKDVSSTSMSPSPKRKISLSGDILRIRFKGRFKEFPFNCSTCGKGYHQEKFFKLHEKAHQLYPVPFQFSCTICKNKSFSTEHRLRLHNSHCHKTSKVRGIRIDPRSTPAPGGVAVVEETQGKGSLNSFQCTYCKTAYNIQDYVVEAGSTKLKIKCDQLDCEKTFSNFLIFSYHHCRTCLVKAKLFLSGSKNENDGHKLKSGIIRQYSGDVSSIPVPVNDKNSEKNVQSCGTCGRKYENVKSLKMHEKRAHTADDLKEISCPECPHKFHSVFAARAHQLRLHGKSLKTICDANGELDSFQCGYCKEEFLKISFLIQEKNSSDNPVKKYLFPPVQTATIKKETQDFKSFHWKYWNHIRHCKSRPRVTQAESYWDSINVSKSCSICKKVYNSVQGARTHEIVAHTKQFKFYCEICGRGCPSNGYLKQHKKTHGEDRPFACEKCPKTFKKKIELDYHMNKHNNIRSFVCEVCGRAYHNPNVLGMHKKQSHKGK